MQQKIADISSNVSYLASGSVVVFGFTEPEWMVIGIISGIMLGIATFALTWHYRHKHYKMELRWKGERIK